MTDTREAPSRPLGIFHEAVDELVSTTKHWWLLLDHRRGVDCHRDRDPAFQLHHRRRDRRALRLLLFRRSGERSDGGRGVVNAGLANTALVARGAVRLSSDSSRSSVPQTHSSVWPR